MYQGNVEDARDYFDGMGYPCPANINPADHYMDVIGGVVKKTDEKFDPRVLFDAWSSHAREQRANGDANDERGGLEDVDNLIIHAGNDKAFVKEHL